MVERYDENGALYNAEDRILYVDKKRSHLISGGTNKRLVSGRIDFEKNIDDSWANVNYEESNVERYGENGVSYNSDLVASQIDESIPD